jgi:hypothetical protein
MGDVVQHDAMLRVKQSMKCICLSELCHDSQLTCRVWATSLRTRTRNSNLANTEHYRTWLPSTQKKRFCGSGCRLVSDLGSPLAEAAKMSSLARQRALALHTPARHASHRALSCGFVLSRSTLSDSEYRSASSLTHMNFGGYSLLQALQPCL